MKTLVKGIFLASALAFTFSVSNAQIVVNVRPERPRTVVVARPPAPSPRHVWVEEDWAPGRRGYAWHGGYWAAPPRPHAVWVAGHWDRRPRGYVWVKGYWR